MYEPEAFKNLTERERFYAFQRARENARIPRIHNHIRDVTIEEGHGIKLTCTASGPELNIRWLKDGNHIEKGPRNRILVNEGILTFEIPRALPSDSGEYTCLLRNPNGDASTSAIVTVYEIIQELPQPPVIISVRGSCICILHQAVTDIRFRLHYHASILFYPTFHVSYLVRLLSSQ